MTIKVDDIDVIELPTEWPVGPVNLFLIKGEKLTLLDAGRRLESSWDLFNAALKERGLSIMDIEQVVLTHHHTDHVGMLDWLLEKNPIPVYAHPNCRPFLMHDRNHFRRAKEFFIQFFLEHGVPNSITEQFTASKGEFRGLKGKVEIQEIEEGAVIPGLSEWKVVETKGHAQSHISLYRPQDKVFLCGDHLIKHMPAGIFLEAPIFPETERSKPLIQYIDNLRKCLSFPISLTLSSHGEPIENVQVHIQETLRKIDLRAQRVKGFLSDGKKKSGYQLIQLLYPNRYEKETLILLSDTVSQLDLLIERSEIVQEEKDGILYYSAKI